MINWNEEVTKRKEDLIRDLFGLLKIESVKDLSSKTTERPMGQEVGEALEYMLSLSEKDGFRAENLDGYAGFLEHKSNPIDEYIGILCHVDVVPATGEWKSYPFEPTIRDGKIFARGAIDDKGPTLAAYYGLKIVKELGLPLKNNVRLIIGTDEESGMSCMKHYREVEKMPVIGFAPDADFPIINAEKGQINVKLALLGESDGQNSPLSLVSFKAGSRGNMVPESAVVVIQGEYDGIIKDFQLLCNENGYRHSVHSQRDKAQLMVYGISAHGMEPHIGKNAGTILGGFLSRYDFQPRANQYLALVKQLHEDFHGASLGIQYFDEITGPLTVNPGIFTYENEGEGSVNLNIRCPVTTDYEATKVKLGESVKAAGFQISDLRESQPHHVDAEHPMIKILQKVYQEETNQKPTLLSTGGATYAKFMEKGVAFGACFPGKEMTAHQKDEYIEIEDLLKATAIYARAIYELANLEL